MNLPSHKHVLVWCIQCQKHEVVLTKTNHFCSKDCIKSKLKEYWHKKYLQRKVDPIAREQVRRAKKKYRVKLKTND